MIIWLGFHLVIICLLFCYGLSKKTRGKITFKWLLLFVLIYFAGYRDGLGKDWLQYVKRLDVYTSIDSLVFGFSEPLFSLIGIMIDSTILSPIFLFLFCAIITNVGIGRFLFEDEKFAISAVLLYIFMPTLYFMSFNITRQFFAVGLFFFALQYVGKSFPKYFLCVFIGALMHMSAILLLPIYWLLKIKISRHYLIPSIIIIMLLAAIALRSIAGMDVKYSEGASSDDTMTPSGMILLYNLFFIPFILSKRIYYSISNRNRNLFLLFIITIDLSYFNYLFYRLSYFFFPVVTLVFPYILYKLTKNWTLFGAYISMLVLLNYYTFIGSSNNKEIVPDRILPVLSIFDTYYGK